MYCAIIFRLLNWSKFEWIICTIHSQRGLIVELLFSSPISKNKNFQAHIHQKIPPNKLCLWRRKNDLQKKKKHFFCHCNNINTFFVILATLVILGTVKKDVSWQLYMWYSCYVRKVCKQWVVKYGPFINAIVSWFMSYYLKFSVKLIIQNILYNCNT